MPGIQLTIQMIMSLLHLMYVLVSQPFQEDSDNMIEILNEGSILFLTTVMTTYAVGDDLDPVIGSNISWLLIALILGTIAVSYTHLTLPTKRIV